VECTGKMLETSARSELADHGCDRSRCVVTEDAAAAADVAVVVGTPCMLLLLLYVGLPW